MSCSYLNIESKSGEVEIKLNNRQKKPKGAIKNGQSKDTGNIGHIIHRAKTNKAQKTQHRKLKYLKLYSYPTVQCARTVI